LASVLVLQVSVVPGSLVDPVGLESDASTGEAAPEGGAPAHAPKPNETASSKGRDALMRFMSNSFAKKVSSEFVRGGTTT
jgi:hypothetical protein